MRNLSPQQVLVAQEKVLMQVQGDSLGQRNNIQTGNSSIYGIYYRRGSIRVA